jgi:hypothetical protein
MKSILKVAEGRSIGGVRDKSAPTLRWKAYQLKDIFPPWY